MNQEPISIFWMRRDLRLFDNAALYHALKRGSKVLCLFVFDVDILGRLPNRFDKRVIFIHRTLRDIKQMLNEKGSDLLVLHDTVLEAWKKVLSSYRVASVFMNRDYEPYAINRDKSVERLLHHNDIKLYGFKDQILFEPTELAKSDGTPYLIFTPFYNKWLSQINSFCLKSYYVKDYHNLLPIDGLVLPSLDALGFVDYDVEFPETKLNDDFLRHYVSTRDFPSNQQGTSRLGLHLRFGTVSIRQLAKTALTSPVFLKELIWREFFMHILYHFPHTVDHAFRKEFDNIRWKNDEAEFEKWCKGQTGYPLVDAGMRELNETGFMHNRVRMVAASFLTKHLLIDWRWGERYFAEKLLDFDLAANVGNWQWAAGCGCDAAPYFRVFNPYVQAERFDPKGEYIRKWVPELGAAEYPPPIVEHKMARERALQLYAEGIKLK